MGALPARRRPLGGRRCYWTGVLVFAFALAGAVPTTARPHDASVDGATTLSTHATLAGAATVEESSPAAAAEMIAFARDPHFHAGRIVFSYRGNLWVVNADGTDAAQLTRTPSRDERPRWSPNGEWIAFTSDRRGNDDVFVIPAAGGEPRQLTHYAGNDDVQYWTPDGQRIVFSTNRGPYSWESPLYTVSIDGGLPVMIPMGAGAAGMFSQDGSMLAFNRISYPDPRRNYRGARTASVWVMDVANGTFDQLTNTVLEQSQNHIHDAYPMWGADGWIYFMSERSGIFNIWKIRPEGGEAVQVTRHTRGGVRFPSMSPDGRTITYSQEFELWVLPVEQAEPRRLAIDLGYTIDRELTEIVSTENTADNFAPSPDGRFVAVDFRGELFVVPAEEGVGERQRITESAWRQGEAVYSPDGRHLAYVSDETGEQELWLHDLQTGQKRMVTEHASKKQIELWAPDAGRLYWQADQRLYVSDVDGGTEEVVETRADVLPPEVFRPGFDVTDISPDGRWLVLERATRPTGLDREDIDVFLHDTETGREYNVTAHPARDGDGFFSRDGSKVFFVSDRANGTRQLFSVALTYPSENPNDPLVREREARAAGDRGGEAEVDFSVEIDVRRIDDRAVQLTTGGDAVSDPFLGADGETIYFLSGSGGSRSLTSVSVDGDNRRSLAEAEFDDMIVTGDRRTVFYMEDDEIQRMPLASREAEPVPFEISFAVDKREEWRQMFDELYRHWKYSYVEEDYLGYDWDAIRDRLEPAVEEIGTTQDFYMLAAEMVFSLRSSHTGVGAPREPTGRIGGESETRYLGFEVEPEDGGLRITHIYRHGPAAEPWLDLEEGEFLLALDGEPLTATTNYWELLTDRLNEFATVTVGPRPDAPDDQRRDLRIETVGSMSSIRYEDFVTRSREFVDSISDGRIAYFHMRSMNQGTLERLKYEIDQYAFKDGMILDVRYNGGGNIDRQLMDVLQRAPYQWTTTRNGTAPGGARRPQQLIHGPKVMMHNHRSGSNAEMVPQAFKHNGVGPTVGTPTAGAVVSASGYGLLDGGSTRIPRIRVNAYDASRPDRFGYNLENYGVPPDIWARNTPEEELERFDRELLLAVEEALRLLETGEWQQEPAPVQQP